MYGNPKLNKKWDSCQQMNLIQINKHTVMIKLESNLYEEIIFQGKINKLRENGLSPNQTKPGLTPVHM